MEDIIVEKKSDTPLVNFLFSQGIIILEGRSLPENVYDFYAQLINGVKKYSENNVKELVFRIKMDYFNTASSKMILEIFEVLPENSIIEWYYHEDDEDMQEAGEGWEELLKATISLKLIPTN